MNNMGSYIRGYEIKEIVILNDRLWLGIWGYYGVSNYRKTPTGVYVHRDKISENIQIGDRLAYFASSSPLWLRKDGNEGVNLIAMGVVKPIPSFIEVIQNIIGE